MDEQNGLFREIKNNSFQKQQKKHKVFKIVQNNSFLQNNNFENEPLFFELKDLKTDFQLIPQMLLRNYSENRNKKFKKQKHKYLIL